MYQKVNKVTSSNCIMLIWLLASSNLHSSLKQLADWASSASILWKVMSYKNVICKIDSKFCYALPTYLSQFDYITPKYIMHYFLPVVWNMYQIDLSKECIGITITNQANKHIGMSMHYVICGYVMLC